MAKYDKELIEEAFQRWHKGETETSIANDNRMPSRQTINKWKNRDNWVERSDGIKNNTQQKIDKELSKEDFKHYKITDQIIGLGLKQNTNLRISGDTVLKAIDTQRRILGIADKLSIDAKIDGGLTLDDLRKANELYDSRRKRDSG